MNVRWLASRHQKLGIRFSLRTTQRLTLRTDFAEYKGQNYLIIVDSYSKWLHVESMSSITSSKAIHSLRQLFSTHGLCAILYSDDATQGRIFLKIQPTTICWIELPKTEIRPKYNEGVI